MVSRRDLLTLSLLVAFLCGNLRSIELRGSDDKRSNVLNEGSMKKVSCLGPRLMYINRYESDVRQKHLTLPASPSHCHADSCIAIVGRLAFDC